MDVVLMIYKCFWIERQTSNRQSKLMLHLKPYLFKILGLRRIVSIMILYELLLNYYDKQIDSLVKL